MNNMKITLSTNEDLTSAAKCITTRRIPLKALMMAANALP